jgi:hypothetical protein
MLKICKIVYKYRDNNYHNSELYSSEMKEVIE